MDILKQFTPKQLKNMTPEMIQTILNSQSDNKFNNMAKNLERILNFEICWGENNFFEWNESDNEKINNDIALIKFQIDEILRHEKIYVVFVPYKIRGTLGINYKKNIKHLTEREERKCMISYGEYERYGYSVYAGDNYKIYSHEQITKLIENHFTVDMDDFDDDYIIDVNEQNALNCTTFNNIENLLCNDIDPVKYLIPFEFKYNNNYPEDFLRKLSFVDIIRLKRDKNSCVGEVSD